MLRPIVQTRRKYKKEDDKQHENQKSDIGKEKESQENSEGETQEGSSTDTDCDQDSDVSFAENSDKEIDTAELEQEDWIEHEKKHSSRRRRRRRNEEGQDPCWIEMHRRMKWRLAVKIAPLPKERWVRKAAEWNLGLSIKIKTCRAVERPKKRWEDELHDVLTTEETEATKGSDVKNNDTWKNCSKAKRQMEGKRRRIRGSRQKEKVGIK